MFPMCGSWFVQVLGSSCVQRVVHNVSSGGCIIFPAWYIFCFQRWVHNVFNSGFIMFAYWGISASTSGVTNCQGNISCSWFRWNFKVIFKNAYILPWLRAKMMQCLDIQHCAMLYDASTCLYTVAVFIKHLLNHTIVAPTSCLYSSHYCRLRMLSSRHGCIAWETRLHIGKSWCDRPEIKWAWEIPRNMRTYSMIILTTMPVGNLRLSMHRFQISLRP